MHTELRSIDDTNMKTPLLRRPDDGHDHDEGEGEEEGERNSYAYSYCREGYHEHEHEHEREREQIAQTCPEQHDLTELELSFVSGPFLAAQRDKRGLADLKNKLGRELTAVFDAIDINGDDYLEPEEVINLALAIGCTEEEAKSAARRVFHEILVDSINCGRMSREQWLVFFHCLLSRCSDGENSASSLEGDNLVATREALRDLAAECSAQNFSSLAQGLRTVGYASLFHTLSCTALLVACALALPLTSKVDKLYISLVNSTATSTNSALKNMEDGLFTQYFAERASVLLMVFASIGVCAGVFLSRRTHSGYHRAIGAARMPENAVDSEEIQQSSSLHQASFVKSRFFSFISFLTIMTSLAIMVLSGLEYISIGNGNTMCLQECGSVCNDAFPNITANGDDFSACQKLANTNCSCGFDILKGKATEQQILEIKGILPQTRTMPNSELSLHGNFTLTFQGYSTRGIPVDVTPNTMASIISEISLGRNASFKSLYGPIMVRSLVNTDLTRRWLIDFQGCYEDLGAAVMDTDGVNLNSLVRTTASAGGMIMSRVTVLEVGRSGTTFQPIPNTFSDSVIFSWLPAIGLVCALALAVTGVLLGVLGGCRGNHTCLLLRGWTGLGKMKLSSSSGVIGNPKLENIHQRLRSVF